MDLLDFEDEFTERYPTLADIEVLAARFGLPNDEMFAQDWEFLVSDPDRIGDFVEAYRNEPFTESQKNLLMKVILDSCNTAGNKIFQTGEWSQILEWLRAEMPLHGDTVCYFASLGSDDPDAMWNIAPYMREILAAYRADR